MLHGCPERLGPCSAKTAHAVCLLCAPQHRGARPVDAEQKNLIDAFKGTLDGIRTKMATIEAEVKKRGSADPLHTASLRKMEAEHDQIRDDINALYKKANRPHFGGSGSDSPSKLETKANREVAR